MSTNKASEVFNVPRTTIQDRLYGKVDIETIKSGPQPLFNEEQEALQCLAREDGKLFGSVRGVVAHFAIFGKKINFSTRSYKYIVEDINDRCLEQGSCGYNTDVTHKEFNKMATGGQPQTSKNRIFLFRLQMLVIDGGVLVVRNILEQSLTSQGLTFSACLNQEKSTITRLKSRGLITQVQYDVLFPAGGKVTSSSDLDITLIICLLRNLKCFGFNRKFNWMATPAPTDVSMEADIWRLRDFRNKITRISTTTEIQESDFTAWWNDIEQILVRRSSPALNIQQMIDELKTCPFNLAEESSIQGEIKKSKEYEADVDRLKQEKTDMEENITEVKKHLDDIKGQQGAAFRQFSGYFKHRLFGQHWLLIVIVLNERYKLIYLFIYFRVAGKDDSIDLSGQSVPEAFINNPVHYDLYREALSTGFETDKAIRVNVVGNFNQGKTSLTNILVGKPKENVHSTNGVEISHCKYIEDNGDVMLLENPSKINDIEIIDRIAEVAKSREHVLTDNEINPTEVSEYGRLEQQTDSFDEIYHEYEPSFQNTETDNITFETEGKQKTAKMFLKKEAKLSLTPEEMQAFSTCLTSDKSLSNVAGKFEIWDFAGQFIFYATHTLFHSKRAVYLLVFDLSKDLSTVVTDSEFPKETGDRTMEQFIKFWINSIHTYVGSTDGKNPPVILVGTHKDKLTGNELQKSDHAHAYFERIRALFEDSQIINHIQAKDFIVNSVDFNDKEIVKLRKEIVGIGLKHSEIKLPAKWIPLEKKLIQIKYMKIIPFSKVVEIDSKNDFPLNCVEQIKLFLIYHHTKGTLFFFDEEPISAYVVLDTQYLIDAFKCIVTSERFCKKEPQYRDLWDLLRKQGKLKMELIHRVWESNSDFLKHKKEILMFMQRHYIISEVSSFDKNTGTTNGLGWFIVPIFLRDHSNNNTVIEFLKGKRQTSLRFLMLFQYTPVVQIVYCRLIAAVVAKWSVVQIGISKQEKEFLLYENLGVFRLDNLNAGVIELQQNRIEMRVISLCKSRNVNRRTADTFRRFAESVVISDFNKLRHLSTIQEKPFQTCFRCNDENHGLNGGQENFHLETLKGESIVPCLDMPNHEILTKQALSEWYEEISRIQLHEDSQVNEKQLSRISKSIGLNWELLGYELGLSNANIDRISMDNQTSIMKIYKVLLEWKIQQNANATVNALLKAMKSIQTLTVDWDEVLNVVEEIGSTQDK
ncbi:uncharacterized protein LOC132743332 [Ruditapes philippinarum]|uniref:uncharacterized protein LOC132743332 n=1 Tax=Ruditapes philippinarum TaxID=129788 RepID=UPI00295C30AB|nr:uncharacterized protein LOC132743332 [Ruditapes philippinarum]